MEILNSSNYIRMNRDSFGYKYSRSIRKEKLKSDYEKEQKNMFKNLLPPTTHRVKMHTNKKVNQKIKEKTLNSMDIYSTRGTNEISDRIDALNREWDIERTLEANAAALMLIGSTLGLITRKKRWSVLTGVVGGFLLQHAIQGWCPPIPVFRRMYIRTSSEIDSEKYYLKYIRGDFKKWSDK